jgi:hypothetical protein
MGAVIGPSRGCPQCRAASGDGQASPISAARYRAPAAASVGCGAEGTAPTVADDHNPIPASMNDDSYGDTPNTEPKTDWERLRRMTDEEVHAGLVGDADIRPTDEAFWNGARFVMSRYS